MIQMLNVLGGGGNRPNRKKFPTIARRAFRLGVAIHNFPLPCGGG